MDYWSSGGKTFIYLAVVYLGTCSGLNTEEIGIDIKKKLRFNSMSNKEERFKIVRKNFGKGKHTKISIVKRKSDKKLETT